METFDSGNYVSPPGRTQQWVGERWPVLGKGAHERERERTPDERTRLSGRKCWRAPESFGRAPARARNQAPGARVTMSLGAA